MEEDRRRAVLASSHSTAAPTEGKVREQRSDSTWQRAGATTPCPQRRRRGTPTQPATRAIRPGCQRGRPGQEASALAPPCRI